MQRAEKYLNDVSNKSNTLYYKKEKKKFELAQQWIDKDPKAVAGIYLTIPAGWDKLDLLKKSY